VASPRRLGRPIGGGNEPGQAKEALLDAAERSLAKHGYSASTMEVIAREAGYTRAIIYRHFSTRDQLLQAALKRTTFRYIADVMERHGETDLSTLLVESFVMLMTELARDPLYATFAERNEADNVATLLANAAPYVTFAESVIDDMTKNGEAFLREGIRTVDVAKFLVVSALNFLVGIVPGADDPDQVRRYVTVFVLPAIMADPPRPCAVFKPL
jgi:AcrR family transcriptional regulator